MRELIMRSPIVLTFFIIAASAMIALNPGTKPGTLPEGWHMRFDHSQAGPKDATFEKTEYGYHATADGMGAAIYYQDGQSASNQYVVKAHFTQMKPTAHPEAYGLFIGGTDLQKSDQGYLYFLVRQDGKYLIKRRVGDNTETIQGWTATPSVNAMDKNGVTDNELGIHVNADNVIFTANGKELKTIARKDLKYTKGQIGLRINHHLDLQIRNFTTQIGNK